MRDLTRRSLLIAVAGAAATAACSASGERPQAPAAGAAPGFPLTVGNTGRTLTFAAPPARIVSLYPSMTDLLIALGAEGRLVGQAGTGYSAPQPQYKDKAAAVPVLADTEATTEALLNARPDLVVSDQEYHFDGKRLPRRDDLAGRGIQVYINRALHEPTKVTSTVPDSFADVLDLGRILGTTHLAEPLTAGLRQQLSDVEARLAGVTPVGAVLLTSYDSALYAHAGGLYGDVLTRAGARNLTEQAEIPAGEYYGQLSPEVIARKNPEVIVYVYRTEDNRVSSEQEMRRLFAATAAGRSGRFVPIEEASFGGALRSAPAVASLARALHPQAFR
ncbi:ABC transporter substrate-binding protein [Amycolatopsis suaedae]|uniref:ABC transporter substrate-binding protein n=1 Tax=Amycolatopsis suaedae TaxID=2510978 RepID=A0A4Q7JE97_9PSEU|nr:ABC transporter substrate-binding protein [Amycolatopsis suaedae]RZQ64724.1 ABC transporter substrate-binding protein [Amycolatopsis suaedae]